MTNLFVGGLAWHTQEDSLEQAFGAYGVLVEVAVIRDRDNPTRSKGYGFVRFATEEQANQAIEGLNGTELDGRIIRVDRAQESGRTASSARGRRGGGAGGPGGARGPPGGPGGMPYGAYAAPPQQQQQQQQPQQQQQEYGSATGGQDYYYGAGPGARGR